MILFVYGEDALCVQEHVRLLKTRFVEKHDASGMNVAEVVFDGDEGATMSAVAAAPFMASRRMTIVRGLAVAITTKAAASVWAKRLSGRREAVIMLVDEISVDAMKKNKLFSLLDGHDDVHAYAFGVMTAKEAGAWVRARARVAWNDAAIRALLNRVGTDAWALELEMRKVEGAVHAGGGEPSHVIVADVERQVERTLVDELFALLDDVRDGRAREALERLFNERVRGTADEQLLRMLAREVRLLVQMRAFAAKHGSRASSQAARELGIHPYVAKKMMPRALSMDALLLRRMLKSVVDADEALKCGHSSISGALDQAMVDLL